MIWIDAHDVNDCVAWSLTQLFTIAEYSSTNKEKIIGPVNIRHYFVNIASIFNFCRSLHIFWNTDSYNWGKRCIQNSAFEFPKEHLEITHELL